jgi:DNA topoisomerase-3
VGRTTKPVTGFRSRAGRSFRAKLALEQNEEGKWRVEFDEEWARDGAKPPPEEDAPAAAEAQPAAASGNGGGDGAQPAPEAEPVTSE